MMRIGGSKPDYRQLCDLETSIPIFSKDWWLDANCGEDRWDVICVYEGEHIVATLPFAIRIRCGQQYLGMPPGTPWLGPWLRQPQGQKYAHALSRSHRLLSELIDGIPRRCFFRQSFSPEQTNWLPFYWRGFRQTTRYTYLIDLTKDLSSIQQEFKSNARGKIRKANGLVTVKVADDVERFRRLLDLTFARQNLRNPFTRAHLERVDQVLDARAARAIFLATDKAGLDHSALYLIWDAESAYVHMVGEDPALRSSGAGMLLAWEAIQFAKTELRLPIFNFQGSMIQSVESVRRELGARQAPYHSVWRDKRSRLGRLAVGAASGSRRMIRHLIPRIGRCVTGSVRHG